MTPAASTKAQKSTEYEIQTFILSSTLDLPTNSSNGTTNNTKQKHTDAGTEPESQNMDLATKTSLRNRVYQNHCLYLGSSSTNCNDNSRFIVSRFPVSLIGVSIEVYFVLTLFLPLPKKTQPQVNNFTVPTCAEKSILESKKKNKKIKLTTSINHFSQKILDQVWNLVYIQSESDSISSSNLKIAEPCSSSSTAEKEINNVTTTTTSESAVTINNAEKIVNTNKTNENLKDYIDLKSHQDLSNLTYANDKSHASQESINSCCPVSNITNYSIIGSSTSSTDDNTRPVITIQKRFQPSSAHLSPPLLPLLPPITYTKPHSARTITVRTKALVTKVIPYLPAVRSLTHTRIMYERAPAVSGRSMSTLKFTEIVPRGGPSDDFENVKSDVDKAVKLVIELMN